MTNIVALQLYTVRDETAKHFAQTLYRVAEIGYAGVEFAGYGSLASKDLAAILADTGLWTVGTHVSLASLEKDFEYQVNYSLDLGCTLLVVPWISEEWRTVEGIKRLGDLLNHYGQQARERGMTLAYHNHDFEFRPTSDGELLINKFIAATDPALVKLEFDTYWAAFAHVDPIAFIQQHGERIISLHLKDMTPEHTFTEVGDGILNIVGYTNAAKVAGIKNYIVENDAPRIPSLESARRSFENIQRGLV